MKKLLISLCCFMLCITLVLGFSGCGSLFPVARATDLMKDVKAETVIGKNADNRFTGQMAAMSAELFKRSAAEGKNTLVSPLSVAMSLAMTANGADGETLKQMAELIGGDISVDELNEYFYGYIKNLPSEPKAKLGIANSIWFRDDENRLKVEKDFLQTNADYYNAGAYKAPFDDSTIKAINLWVDDNTDGMIDSIIDEIFEDTVMYLINAIVFDAEWEKVYNKENLSDGTFNAYDGTKQNVRMMSSEESLYLDDGMATGFVKNYVGGNYSFAALLPNSGIDVDDYISSLSGSRILTTLNSVQTVAVNATMPKFSFDFKLVMNDLLIDMGMTDAFSSSEADFGKMATSSRGNIYVGEVLHKTFISVDELGTKAGAVTKVEMRDEMAVVDVKTVVLDRPFVFMIIDNGTDLPLFMGAVTRIG